MSVRRADIGRQIGHRAMLGVADALVLGAGRLRGVRQRHACGHMGQHAPPRRLGGVGGVVYQRDTGDDLVFPAWVVVDGASATCCRIATGVQPLLHDIPVRSGRRHGDAAGLMG